MSLPGSIPVLRLWPLFGPAVLLLILVAVSAAIWAGTSPAGAQDSAELQVSVTADPPNPEVNEATRLTATIANPPSEDEPEYDWEGSLEGGEWYSHGSRSSLSWLTGQVETWAFRVTVTYGSGETATSEAVAVTWSEPAPEPTPTPTPEPTQEPTPEPTQEPTPEPTQEPTPEPTQEPTPEPTQESTPEPTQEPTPEPTQEPTPEPTQEPTPEPTQEPTPEPTQEPTPEPTQEPTPTPAPTPSPAPSVTRVAVTSNAGDDNTYILGDVIQITLTFTEAVDVTGSPRLKIDMDPADWGEKQAAYQSGSGTYSLVFAHTVVEPNYSTQGIAVLEDSLDLNGGAIKSEASDTEADLAHDGRDHDPDHKVDWRQSPITTPTVTAVAITSDAGDEDTYLLGDIIRITLIFSESVNVTGAPRLKIDMDPAEWGEKQAAYHGGSGTAVLTFTHEVVEPNISTQGIAVLENSLELNGGSIKSASFDIDAELSHDGRDHDPSHKVDWQRFQPNRAPVVNTQSENYRWFTGDNNAPSEVLVSKPFYQVFRDPDGDELTYTVSIPEEHRRLVEELVVTLDKDFRPETRGWPPIGTYDRVFFQAADDAEWKAISPALTDPVTVTATLTATDPEGLSVSLDGDFLIWWESHPEVVSAAAGEQAIELTFDIAVLDDPAPTAEQFTVSVVNEDGTTGTVSVSQVSVNGAVVTLNLAMALASGQTVTLDYTHDADTPLKRDSEGGDHAPGFQGQAVDMSQLEPQPVHLPRSAALGYRGQLAEVLVELSLQRPERSNRWANGGAGIASGPSVSSTHTTSIVYVIDDSGSMDGDFPEVRAALREVRGTDMANTKVALVAFGTDATRVFGLTDHSTDEMSGPWTDARINAFGGKLGGTYYTAPLKKAKELLDADATATTKKIIFLTDAQAARPTATVKAIDDAGIIVDTIGFGDHFSDKFSVIEKIATDTGGAYRTVTKPSQGTTNDPAVTATAMSDILKGAVADNTATLFLVDYSFSVYRGNEGVLHPALTAAAAKAGESSGTGRQVGLAIFLGETTLSGNPPIGWMAEHFRKYLVVNTVGSSSLSMEDATFYSTGSTDIENALSQAFDTITHSSVTATSKRVVLITDGISAADVQGADVAGSALKKYKDDSAVTLDVVAWGEHADRVKLKGWADSDSGTFSVAKAGPAVPKGVMGLSGEGTFTLSWEDPGDSAITKYQYRQWLDAESSWSAWTDIPGSGASTTWHIFTGLTDGQWYFFRLRAMRGDTPGASTGTLWLMSQDGDVDLTATAGNGEIALSWTDPSDSSITKYQYAQRTEDGAWSAWTDIPGSGASTTSHTVTSLTNDTAYTIALRAVKGTGDTATYDLLSSVTATPAAPGSG